MDILAKPGPTTINAFTTNNPINIPEMAPDNTTPIIAFLFCKVTPYNAGSVIPIKAEIPADNAVCFKFSSLDFNATAKQAPLSLIL